jgi:hypothetical protein
MYEDDVPKGDCAAREAYAKLHNFDVRAMVADLRTRNRAGDWPVVRNPPRRPASAPQPAVVPNES